MTRTRLWARQQASKWSSGSPTAPDATAVATSIARRANARAIAGAAEEPHARELIAAKYYGWREGPLPNTWSRTALPVAITLDTADPPGAVDRGTVIDDRSASSAV